MTSGKLPAAPSLPAYQPWLLGLLLVVAIAAVFGPVVHYDFVVWDDDLHVYANPHFQPVTWAHVRAFWQAPYAQLYIPLTYTVWAALAWLSQSVIPGPLTAEVFHRCNLLLHMGSVLVVYRLGCLVLTHGQPTSDQRPIWAAAAGALVFGLHPLQVEAVAWVSGLKDVLCGWWAVVALWQYLEYARRPPGRQRWLYYALASITFGFALCAKPAAVAVPLIAWVIAVRGLGSPWSQATRALGGWLVVAGLWTLWTKGQQLDAVMEFVTPLWARPVIVIDTLAFYLEKLVWPVQLGPDYGRTPQVVLAQGWRTLAELLLGVGLVGLGLWRQRNTWNKLWLATGVFVAGTLPVLGIVPFVFQAYSTVADRYVYIAMLGPALGVGAAVQWLQSQWRVRAVGILVFALLGWCSAAQVRVWQNTETLFAHTLRVNPRSTLAHNNLGLTIAQQGRFAEAVEHFQMALTLKPNATEAHYNLAKVSMLQGHYDTAIAHFTIALQLRPVWPEAHNNLGVALAAQGKHSEAMTHYALALVAKPDWAEAHYNLGNALAQQGQTIAAMAAYRAALHWRPAWPQAAVSLAQLSATLPASVPLSPQGSTSNAVP
jgi:tetratricopeptide (TPR) repeat protein